MACAITMSCARMHLGLHAPRPHLAIVTTAQRRVRDELVHVRYSRPPGICSLPSVHELQANLAEFDDTRDTANFPSSGGQTPQRHIRFTM